MPDSLIDTLVQRYVNNDMAAEQKQRQFDGPSETKGSSSAAPLSPKMALLLGSLADSASTFNFLGSGSGRESNPALQVFNKSRWSVLPAAAGGLYGYSKIYDALHSKHPKVADTLAGILGGWHGALAGNNLETSNQTLDLDSNAHAMRDLAPRRKQ